MVDPLQIDNKKSESELQLEETYKKLYDSEKYLRAIIESSLDGIAVTDERGRFEFVNDAACDIGGWSRKELLGESFKKVIPEDRIEFMLKKWDEIQKDIGGPYETKIITKNGEIRDLYVSYTRTEINAKRKYVFTIKDITENKKLELRLKESEARYRDLFENASDSIYCYDSKGYFLDVNTTALRLLGCTKEELIGTHISEWITPESLKITQEDLKKRVAGETGRETMVLDVINKKGEHHCMEIRRRVIREGDKIIVHGIGRDITEKRRLERELKESEARYRELFDNAIDAIYTQDLEGRLLTINEAGLKILGCTRDEVIGSHFSKWITPESLKVGREVLERILSGEIITKPIMIEIICKNGEHKWAEFTLRLVKEGNRITGIHGIGRDVTEYKRLKQELKESNKQLKLLWYLIVGTRGGNARALILKHLIDRTYNANQLAKALNMDYKTIRHHLDVLVKNGIVIMEKDKKYGVIYFLSKMMEANLKEFDLIV